MSSHRVLVATLVFLAGFESFHAFSFDNEQDCYDALHAGGRLDQCKQEAVTKWKLTNSVKDSAVDTCCAMFEALNCVLNSSCHICPGKDLSDWAHYRKRAIYALDQSLCKDTPYDAYSANCKQHSAPPLELHCDNEPAVTTESHGVKMAVILALIFIVSIILVIGLGLIVHLAVGSTSDAGNRKTLESVKTNTTGGGGGKQTKQSKQEKQEKTISFKVKPVPTNASVESQAAQPWKVDTSRTGPTPVPPKSTPVVKHALGPVSPQIGDPQFATSISEVPTKSFTVASAAPNSVASQK